MNACKNIAVRNAVVACVLAVAPGMALAGAGADVEAIARATGLTCSEVQMVVGARTPHPEYFTSFERSQRRMIKVLGRQRFNDLMAGRRIVLDDGQRVALAQR